MTSNQIALIQTASDSVLIDLLFALARSGEAGDEFAVIDAEVYGRFARSYGQPLDEAHHHGAAHHGSVHDEHRIAA